MECLFKQSWFVFLKKEQLRNSRGNDADYGKLSMKMFQEMHQKSYLFNITNMKIMMRSLKVKLNSKKINAGSFLYKRLCMSNLSKKLLSLSSIFFFLAHPLPTSVIYKMPGIVEEIHHLFEEVIMMQRVGRSFYTPVQSWGAWLLAAATRTCVPTIAIRQSRVEWWAGSFHPALEVDLMLFFFLQVFSNFVSVFLSSEKSDLLIF